MNETTKYYLKEDVIFGNLVENPNQIPTKKGTQIYIDEDFLNKHKEDNIEWAWFKNRLGHLASLYFEQITTK